MGKQTSLAQLRKTEGRGKILTILLVLDSLVVFNSVFNLPYEIYKILSLHQTGYWLDTLFSLLNPLLGSAIAIGMWKWKKTAVYSHFLLMIVNITTTSSRLIVLFQHYWGWLIFWELFYLFIWFMAIKPKWHLFS
jgi:hypothetical protein